MLVSAIGSGLPDMVSGDGSGQRRGVCVSVTEVHSSGSEGRAGVGKSIGLGDAAMHRMVGPL